MSADHVQLEGPDLSVGVKLSAIADGAMLTGHVGDQAVVLARRGDELFAVGAKCPHYGGPLGEGVIVGETIRCPWHHACFSLRSGEVLRAPARDPLPRWRVEVSDGIAYARERIERQPRPTLGSTRLPESVVIIGGGPAGNMAAETLRDEGYAGPITMLSADADLPADRPNLSKDYLAGRASEEWALLRPADFYHEKGIDLRLNTRVARIDTGQRAVELADGSRLSYGALLLATGAEPVRLDVPGAKLHHVHYLRTLDDSRALIAKAEKARRAVIVGASFIGLEAASSLRARGLEVHVVGPEPIPMARVLGPELGSFIRSVHEQHGVTFHLGRTATSIDEHGVTLDNGERIDADLVVVGIGVRPAIGARRTGGSRHRPRSAGRSIPRNQRPGRVRRRRHRPLAGSAQRRSDPRRAFRRRRAPGPDGGAQHARPQRTLRCGPVLLDRAARPLDRLCRPCREMGRDRDRRLDRGAQLFDRLSARRPQAGGGGDPPRS